MVDGFNYMKERPSTENTKTNKQKFVCFPYVNTYKKFHSMIVCKIVRFFFLVVLKSRYIHTRNVK